MPNPLRARLNGARNLRNGPGKGRPKGRRNAVNAEVRAIARKLVLDPRFQRVLRAKMNDGTLHPSVMVMLYYYAFGKPAEVVETIPPVPVRIVHQYSA
jgi:hypothetical protein